MSRIFRGPAITAVASFCLALITGSMAHGACPAPSQAIGVARVVEIDTTNGPLFGQVTHFSREPSFLSPKEVVLTFDDGPVPWITRSILATLARHCTRATFFPVGRMAIAYPAVVRETLAHGHTVGSHTWSHPLSLPRLKPAAAVGEIDKGFAAVALAANRPIAPFFRFPGLNDSTRLLDHLASTKAATFSIDVVSEDSFVDDADEIARLTMDRLKQRGRGILLFHDIKPATARALPVILDRLKAGGYRVVHIVSKHAYVPERKFEAELRPRLGKAIRHADGVAPPEPASGIANPLDVLKSKVPFFGAVPPVVLANPGTPVTTLAPDRKRHTRAPGGPETAHPSTRNADSAVAAPEPNGTAGHRATSASTRRIP